MKSGTLKRALKRDLPPVFTLQSMMLIVLGVLMAGLAMILIAPAYRRRIVRLTTETIRQSVPITEAEIRADKDRLRAQYAIRVHKLEAQGEQQRLAAARQLVEMNRRDARITELDTDLERLRASLEENVNARRVLEHTVTDRLPRLEQQLGSARTLISARDQEMSLLKAETTRSVRALDEALQINAQQRSELERMSTSLSSRAAASRESVSEPRFDGEIALRSEIEALRAKTRDQAQAISRMQAATLAATQAVASAGVGATTATGAQAAVSDAEESARMQRDLAQADAELKAIRTEAQAAGTSGAATDARTVALKAKVDDQAAEIARLKAALAAYESESQPADGQRQNVIRDSRIAAKAKVSSLQAQIETQNETIQKLRAELAANNERLARQAAQYTEEMRRLGAGAIPASAETRRGRETSNRRSLSDRISQPTPVSPEGAQSAARQDDGGHGAERSANTAKVADYLKALTDDAPVRAANESEPATASSADPRAAATSNSVTPAGAAMAIASVAAAAGAIESNEPTGQRKVRLLDRIAGINKN